MATSYEFYTGTYRGNSITSEDWNRLEQRATETLAQYKRNYTIESPAPNSEGMAICAVADTLYYYECASNGLISTSSSIGSVSTSGVAVDTSPNAQAKEIKKAIKLHLNLYRGIRC